MNKFKAKVEFRFLSHYNLASKEIEAFNNKFVFDSTKPQETVFIESIAGDHNHINLRHVVGRIANIDFEKMIADIEFYDTPDGIIYRNQCKNFFICGKYLQYDDKTLKLISYVTYSK